MSKSKTTIRIRALSIEGDAEGVFRCVDQVVATYFPKAVAQEQDRELPPTTARRTRRAKGKTGG